LLGFGSLALLVAFLNNQMLLVKFKIETKCSVPPPTKSVPRAFHVVQQLPSTKSFTFSSIHLQQSYLAKQYFPQ
jgi:hypothetical protein